MSDYFNLQESWSSCCQRHILRLTRASSNYDEFLSYIPMLARHRHTLYLKKVPTFKFSVTLSYLKQFSKLLHCWKAHEICYKRLTHRVAQKWHIYFVRLNFTMDIGVYKVPSRPFIPLSPLTVSAGFWPAQTNEQILF